MASDAERVIEVLLAMRKALEAEPGASTIAAFLIVATNPGISSSELFQRLGLPSKAASRAVSALLPQHRGGREGLGLAIAEEDPQDRRKRLYRLSEQGEAVWAAIKEVLEG